MGKPRHCIALCRKGGEAVGKHNDTAEAARWRALQDAKGAVMREGVYCTDGRIIPWQKRRALYGRTDQVEIVYDGKVHRTTGETLLRNKLRWLRGV